MWRTSGVCGSVGLPCDEAMEQLLMMAGMDKKIRPPQACWGRGPIVGGCGKSLGVGLEV